MIFRTLQISHSLRPLVAGPIRNAENMESLAIDGAAFLRDIKTRYHFFNQPKKTPFSSIESFSFDLELSSIYL